MFHTLYELGFSSWVSNNVDLCQVDPTSAILWLQTQKLRDLFSNRAFWSMQMEGETITRAVVAQSLGDFENLDLSLDILC